MNLTPEEIIEGNKLIPEFLEWELRTDISTSGCLFFQQPNVNLVFIVDPANDPYDEFMHMQFHSSWNWIMPVVEKIGTIIIPAGKVSEPWPTDISYSISRFQTSFCIGDNSLFITEGGLGNSTEINKIPLSNEAPIQRTFKACVNFIKWYNTQKS